MSPKAASKKSVSGASKAASARKSAGLPSKPGYAAKRVKPSRELDIVDRLQVVVTQALENLKARDVREIDVRGKTSVTDTLFIASGTSSRHVKSIADEVVVQSKKLGLPPLGVEGQREGEWVLVDLGDIIVHVMLPRIREFYGLERLWTVGDDDQDSALAATG